MNNAEKLVRRIKRDFQKCTYIGDISINDEEYVMLKQFLCHGYNNIINSASHESINPLLAVALVQIGIRYYDGRFWPHVKKELGIEKMPQNHQNWIGTSFYKTLLKYGKFHVDESEFMNNILLHCFITKYYADDLFDFILAYYQIDLDRDLSRNNPEMRKYLMQSMSKGESTKRAYKIKKHTADAVSANPKGCKIRVGRILRFMDNALFNDSYPSNSQNRIAQLFCEWAESSKKFDIEKKRTRGLNHRGEKRFSTPYIHFDTKSEHFCLILPQQYIHLDNNEEIPTIDWKVKIGESSRDISTNPSSCVTGCKTERIETYTLLPDLLLKDVNIELWKNGNERIRKFKIKSDSIRFFDSDWDMIDSSTYDKYLPAGNAHAFCCLNEVLLSNSDSIIDCEKKLGYNLYTLNLEKGDILRLPNGKAKSVGKSLEEGVLSQNLVSRAYAVDSEQEYLIYNSVPAIYFRMKPTQENGTLIIINGAKYRFDIEKCVRFDIDEETEEKGYIVKLCDLIVHDGIYDIIVDVPNSKKERRYSFALLSEFSYRYENSPYIFQKKGKITFPGSSTIRYDSSSSSEHISSLSFDIHTDQDYLPFVYDTGDKPIYIRILVPALKWKFDNDDWNILRPEEIWHKDFPKKIYVKYPDDEIVFSMSPTMLETPEEDDEDNSFSAKFNKSKGTQIFECDTRKMVSWFGYEEAKRVLKLELGEQVISFANIITRCFLNGEPIIQENINSRELVIKSNISGFSDCVADICCDDKILAEKQRVTTSGIHLKVPFKSGDYKIVFYEWDDEDDEFGFADYRKFDERIVHFESRYDLSGKEILIKSVTKRQNMASIFSAEHYELSQHVSVKNIVLDENNCGRFCGECKINGLSYTVQIIMKNQAQTQAVLSYYSEEDDAYFDFLYDKAIGALAIFEDESLNAIQKKTRYIFLDSEDYIYNIQIK